MKYRVDMSGSLGFSSDPVTLAACTMILKVIMGYVSDVHGWETRYTVVEGLPALTSFEGLVAKVVKVG